MPELPEVEVSRLGIQPHVQNQIIRAIIVRQPKLRWPIPETLQTAVGLRILKVERRAKYLLLITEAGRIVLHLGMSGSLTVQSSQKMATKHDHLDIVLESGHCLRLNDPRRFGACLWWPSSDETIPGQPNLFAHLGPEPLTEAFDGKHLFNHAKLRKGPVKNLIMDNKVVVGVGNIYASESLFLAGIDPRRSANRISLNRYNQLSEQIKTVLSKAIEQGGTTLKDFLGADGKPGYFKQQLNVYGRKDEPCVSCGTVIQTHVIGQRNSYFCHHCQK